MTASGEINGADIVSLAQQLVRFPSPQTERMEAEPAVQEFIGQCVAPVMQQRGMSGRRDRMGNLILEFGPQSGERSLLLMAYAMNHPASAMKDPYSGALVDAPEGKAIRGRGIAEQKGALAAAIVASQIALSSGPLRGRLVFALSSAGETGRHDAARAILDELGYVPQIGVVALGTNNRVAVAHKGRLDIEIIVHGRATHSSTPWLGVNAIDGARRVLEVLGQQKLDDAVHPHLGNATLTSTRVQSFPAATHTIQNEVRLTFDRRLLPGQDPEQAFEEVSGAIAAIAGPWQIEVRRGPFMYPCEISQAGTLFQAIMQSRRELGREPPGVLYSHGALDAGFLGVKGCDAAMWGPGRMELFHSDEETLLVSELAESAADYLALIRHWLT